MKSKKIKTAFKNKIIETNREVVSSWEKLKNGISQAADKVVGKRKLIPSKPWMTNNIIVLIEKSNKLRNIGGFIGYKIIKNQIDKSREEKEKWAIEIVEQINDTKVGRIDRTYRKI